MRPASGSARQTNDVERAAPPQRPRVDSKQPARRIAQQQLVVGRGITAVAVHHRPAVRDAAIHRRPRPPSTRGWAPPAPGRRVTGTGGGAGAATRATENQPSATSAALSAPASRAPRRLRAGASRLTANAHRTDAARISDRRHARGHAHGVESRQLDQPRKRRLVPEAMTEELAIGPQHEDGGEDEQRGVERGQRSGACPLPQVRRRRSEDEQRIQRQAERLVDLADPRPALDPDERRAARQATLPLPPGTPPTRRPAARCGGAQSTRGGRTGAAGRDG